MNLSVDNGYMKIRRSLYVIFLCFLASSKYSLFAQVSPEEIRASLIVHFCENITWDRPITNEFIIGYEADNQSVYNILESARKKVRIQGLNFSIRLIKSMDDINGCHALYFNLSDQKELVEIFNLARKNRILLVTDNYTDQLFVMINIIDENEKVAFKVNMPNLTLAGFTVHTNLLLNGGSVVDIKTAYEKFENQLKENRVRLDETMKSLSASEVLLKQRDQTIAEKDSEIDRSVKEMETYKLESNRLAEMVTNEKKLLNQSTLELKNKDLELRKIYKDIEKKQHELGRLQSNVADLTKDSDSLRIEIDKKNFILDVKDQQVSNQKRLIILFLAFMGALLFAAFSFFRLFYAKRRHNEELGIANAELRKTNDELNIQKAKLDNALQELKNAQMQIIQSEKMASLGVLTAGVAHEINNPLNFVQSGLYALENTVRHISIKPELADDLRYIMDSMNTGVQRASAIVKSLNTLSRSNTQSIVVCDLHQIIENSLLIIDHEIKNNCSVITKFTSKKFVLKANEESLHQVFINLFMNAVQSMKNFGELLIKTDVNYESVTITISDNGTGIREDVMNRIFDPFFTTKDPGKGVGLGLSIVYKIIKEHNGDISFSSEENVGTKVLIRLPVNT
jgi:signal transduction histidine kinase